MATGAPGMCGKERCLMSDVMMSDFLISEFRNFEICSGVTLKKISKSLYPKSAIFRYGFLAFDCNISDD